jgi:hypothetical protein
VSFDGDRRRSENYPGEAEIFRLAIRANGTARKVSWPYAPRMELSVAFIAHVLRDRRASAESRAVEASSARRRSRIDCSVSEIMVSRAFSLLLAYLPMATYLRWTRMRKDESWDRRHSRGLCLWSAIAPYGYLYWRRCSLEHAFS